MTESKKAIEQGESLENFWTEEALCKQIGMNRVQIANMRNFECLPFLRINRGLRLYRERDVLEWLIGRKTVLEFRPAEMRRIEREEGRERRKQEAKEERRLERLERKRQAA